MASRFNTMVATHRRLRAQGDEGIAMVMVIGTMVALTVIVATSLAYAVQGSLSSRRSQAYVVAEGAAQAGIDDYLQRLSTCDTYWQAPCATSAADNTNNGTGWVNIPGTGSTSSRGQYTYKLLNPSSTNILRLFVQGRSFDPRGKAVTRSFTVDLAKPGLLNYIYYTDLEALDPLVYSTRFPAGLRSGTGSCTPTISNGVSCYDDINSTPSELAGIRAACGADASGANQQYYWAGRANASWARTYTAKSASGVVTTGHDDADCTEIQFASGDTISGAFHTNDSMQINGAKFAHPRTQDRTETSWPTTSSIQPATAGNLWWGSGPTTGGTPTGYAPVYAPVLTLPPNNTSIKAQADPLLGGQGCLYTGPTRIVLRSDGKLTVTSPYSRQVNPGCSTSSDLNNVNMTTAQTVTGPANGVIYVQAIPSASSDPNVLSSGACALSTETSSVGYPVATDITPYLCSDGDAFVSGSGFKGRYTIAAANDVNVVGPITYSSKTGSDILGLVPNSFVQVYHPVTAGAVSLTSSMDNVEIDAAMLSVQDSFIVPNWDKGSQAGTLTVFGGIYQKYRGTVGTSSNGSCSNGTGYCKNYSYDSRLALQPPPFFLNPVNAQWRVVNEGEQARQ